MLHQVAIILAALSCSLAQNGSPPQSPCPAVFRYSYSQQGWHGVISIIPPLVFSEVQLVLRLAVSKYIPGLSVGQVEVLGGDTELQNIAQRAGQKQQQRVQFLVVFPPYNEFPRISSVQINGYEFCSAPAYDTSRGVIQLKYTLKTGLSLAVANGSQFYSDGTAQPVQPTWTQPIQPAQREWTQPQQPAQQPWTQPVQPAQQPWTPPVQPAQQPWTPPVQPAQQPWTQPVQPAQQPWTQPVQPAQRQDPTQGTQVPRIVTARAPTRPPRPRATSPASVSIRVDGSDEVDYTEVEDEEDDYRQQYEVNGEDCGLQSVSAVNELVVRGEHTKKGDWPWMAAIFTTSGAHFRCGGSLISRRHVVTAAHCLTESTTRRPMSTSSLIIHLGVYDLGTAEPDEQVIEIHEILINRKYVSSRKQDYDIGLIVLKTAAVINHFVRPVCLWDDTLARSLINNKIGLAPGWGKDEHGESAMALKLAPMPVVSQSKCVESDPDFFGALISDKTFCAGFRNGTTLCNGDSGGGLFFSQVNPKTRKKAWFVRGIVSLSKRNEYFMCGETNYVVFTDIASVLGWIKSKLKPPSTPPSS